MGLQKTCAPALLSAACPAGAAVAQSADLSVMSTVAYKDAYLEMLPAFERASGRRVNTQWVPTVEVLRRITTVFSAGLHVSTRQAEVARAWVKVLKSPEAAVLYRRHGMEPA